MRLRRKAGSDFDINDRNNGYRHEHAFVKNIRRNGILHESDLLADSYGGKFHPRAVPELLSGLPTAATGLARGKMTPQKILLHQHKAPKDVKRMFDEIDGRKERVELNLYVTGYEEEEDFEAGESQLKEERAEAKAEAAERPPEPEAETPVAAPSPESSSESETS